MRPAISVCLPSYNFSRYLSQAIDSVLAQTFTDFELLIIDDCSTDDSLKIIRAYAERDRRIRVRTNDRNIGMVPNWNECLKHARGEYVKFLFGDDALSDPRALEVMASVMRTNPSVSLVASARYVIDDRSQVIACRSRFRGTGRRDGKRVIQDCVFEQRNEIGEPSVVLFRREHAARGFQDSYRQLVDLEMWFHILEQGDLYFIDQPLCSFREHGEQQTKKNLEAGFEIDEAFRLVREYASRPYIRLRSHQRAYMEYLPAYSVWKLFRTHKRISEAEAFERITSGYGLSRRTFFLRYPFFKAYKFYREMRRKLRGRCAR